MSAASHTSKDIFNVWKQGAEKYFANIEKTTNEFRKAVNDISDKYFDAWKNVTLSTITAQHQLSKQDWN